MSKMHYNTCDVCGATDGRCGNLIADRGRGDKNGLCRNCYQTRERGEVVVYAELDRTFEELQRTMEQLG